MPLVAKLDRVVGDLPWELLPIKSRDLLIMWSSQIMWQTKTIISTTTIPLSNKLDGVVTYLERLLPIKSHDPLITWLARSLDKFKTYLHYCHVYDHQTWQGGDIPWVAPTHKVTWPLTTWSCEVKWQIKKNSYLHYNTTNGKQTWQGDNFLGGIFTHIATLLFNYMVLQDYVTNQKRFISTITMPEATKFSRAVT